MIFDSDDDEMLSKISIEDIFNTKNKMKPSEQLKEIEKMLRNGSEFPEFQPVILFILSIDGQNLRTKKVQDQLAKLASFPNI